MAMQNKLTQEHFNDFVVGMKPEDIFGWITQTKSILHDPVEGSLKVFNTSQVGEDNPQRVLPGPELMEHVAKNNPALVQQMAQAVLISIQLDEKLIANRLNRVRERFGMPALHEVSMEQSVYEGKVIDQNDEQSLLQEQKTGRQVLLEHKRLDKKPAPNMPIRLSYDHESTQWSVRPMAQAKSLGTGKTL